MECSESSAGLDYCLICLTIRRELCNIIIGACALKCFRFRSSGGWKLPECVDTHIATPNQENLRLNLLAKIGLVLDLEGTLNSLDTLVLNHTSTAPRLMTAPHVGTDGYPHQPCHTMTLPFRTPSTLVRLSLRTDTAIKLNMCTTTASAASSVPVRQVPV